MWRRMKKKDKRDDANRDETWKLRRAQLNLEEWKAQWAPLDHFTHQIYLQEGQSKGEKVEVRDTNKDQKG